MATSAPPRRRCKSRAAIAAMLWPLLGASSMAHVCNAPLPAPGSELPSDAKFSLIESQCPALSEPAQTRRARQMDLYSPPLPLGSDAAVPVAPARLPPVRLPAPDGFIGRGGQRVLSVAPALIAAAREHGLDPLLLHAIAHVESRHNAQAVSPAGARGLMQVMPATAHRLGVADPQRSLFDPGTNLRASAALLRKLRDRYGDALQLVLAAYNAGEGAVEKYGRRVPPYPETQAYVRAVHATYRRLSAEFGVDADGGLTLRGSFP